MTKLSIRLQGFARWAMLSLAVYTAGSAYGQVVFIEAGTEVGQGYTLRRGNECYVFTAAHVVYDTLAPRFPITVYGAGSRIARHTGVIRKIGLPNPYLKHIAYFTVDDTSSCSSLPIPNDLDGVLLRSEKGRLLILDKESGGIRRLPVVIDFHDANSIRIKSQEETIHMGLSGSSLLIGGEQAGMLLSIDTDLQGVSGIVVRVDALNRVVGRDFLPDPPSPKLPPDAALLVTTNTTFSWPQVPGATHYDIQYEDTPRFSENIFTRIPSNTFKVYNLSKRTRYYWRVRAIDGSFEGTSFESAWSDLQNFTSGDPTLYRLGQSLIPGWRQWDEGQNFRALVYPSLVLTSGILARVAHAKHWKCYRRALGATTVFDVIRNNQCSRDWLAVRRWSVRGAVAMYVISFIDSYVFPGLAYHPNYRISVSPSSLGFSIQYVIEPGRR